MHCCWYKIINTYIYHEIISVKKKNINIMSKKLIEAHACVFLLHLNQFSQLWKPDLWCGLEVQHWSSRRWDYFHNSKCYRRWKTSKIKCERIIYQWTFTCCSKQVYHDTNQHFTKLRWFVSIFYAIWWSYIVNEDQLFGYLVVTSYNTCQDLTKLQSFVRCN